MKVAVMDYGLGNLHSLVKALEIGATDVRVESDARAAVSRDVLVLPGVGAFGAAAAAIAPARERIVDAINDGLPCLGICLGMQLLCDASDEGPGGGLGVFSGRVTRLEATRVPHIGWNSLEQVDDPIFAASELTMAYFANGYVCRVNDQTDVVAWTTHEADRFPAAVRRGRVLGVQFHPEKSSGAGVRFVRAALTALAQ
ncbi:MAG TPA: imidazole glycerol phosphate synthase subunit HisH [Gemmatimonadaceae bacterium]|nr:imidazole glycerol phosphate synthase subunit HisH [Gemmatimonadaceae bacterium]